MQRHGIEVQDDRIIFHNLVRAGEMIGETRVVEAVKPAAKITNSNARGCMREVESVEAAGRIGTEAATEFLARFGA